MAGTDVSTLLGTNIQRVIGRHKTALWREGEYKKVKLYNVDKQSWHCRMEPEKEMDYRHSAS